ncbi:DE-cadherin [Anthonomus grandis grandis]|uniref:DE-cadherin n=1 Tax=Anthonomus grandis grandis TaxID=2921223 RepID=UPI0021661C58|nr:DE-cadherin [Anthonomus grandis grandis]
MEHMGLKLLLCLFSLLILAHTKHTGNFIDDESNIVSIDSPPGPKSQKILEELRDNNQKPRFLNCDQYNNAEVQEEQNADTFVIQVNATDIDPPESGGSVTYKIITGKGKPEFRIDNRTGEIRTARSFERDEPSPEKEKYVTVQATDNGRPPLSDICTFKVTITDINDNSPQMEKLEYKLRIAEDLPPQAEVQRVFAYDLDDGDNSKLSYKFTNTDPEFLSYFRIDEKTGVVYLNQSLLGRRGVMYSATVVVSDHGIEPRTADAPITIQVVESNLKPPSLVKVEPKTLELPENYDEYYKNLVTIEVDSNSDDKEILFELIQGKTVQTNSQNTFKLEPDTNNTSVAYIQLAGQLNYETETEYNLGIRAKSRANNMELSLNIHVTVTDVNDEIPTFIEVIRGSVLENEREGVIAMEIKAQDKDGTSANNIYSFDLENLNDLFEINNRSGQVRSKKIFDREETAVYHLRVRVYDNSPSALKNSDGKPNQSTQKFEVIIEDRNDNAPNFTKSVYMAEPIVENADVGRMVVEIRATDKDDASVITYSIEGGNMNNDFIVENTTGRIKINNRLDYETRDSYNLTVKAFDGIYSDTAIVRIFVANFDDEKPVFYDTFPQSVNVEEEFIPSECLIEVRAYDPDIKNRSEPQNITYNVEGASNEFLSVSADGCVKLTQKLDRDIKGDQRQTFIFAYDKSGEFTFGEFNIILKDINDNAPYLNMSEVVWYENKDPAVYNIITELFANDIDDHSVGNGPPFAYRFADYASGEIRSKFLISNERDSWYLLAQVMFDREEKKYYDIPILVSDNGTPTMSDVSILRVIIGDVNDNAAKDGSSEIFVYKYDNWRNNIAIGRVFVEDLDDWDLPDKEFIMVSENPYFQVSEEDKGMIIMDSSTQEGNYFLSFNVTEESAIIPRHSVRADVSVTVKAIPKEAVEKSGSVRIFGCNIEEFVEKHMDGNIIFKSKKDILQERLSEILNTSLSNVDVFTVLTSPSNNSFIDVRFSAHGSPYYAPEKLNKKVADNQEELESNLNIKFEMISINECLKEEACGEGNSCLNHLYINDEEPAVVYTNKTSFVGVKSIVQAKCDCYIPPPQECLNNGTMSDRGTCTCPFDNMGPYCEYQSVAFEENSWAMYPGLEVCNFTEIRLTVRPYSDKGLIFFAGPMTFWHASLSKHYLALELRDGNPVLIVENGGESRPKEIASKYHLSNELIKINDGGSHQIRITIKYTNATKHDLEFEVDGCQSICTQLTSLRAPLLRINGPLQMGGLSTDFTTEEIKTLWNGVGPTDYNLGGCVEVFTLNGRTYNLGQPSDSKDVSPNCSNAVKQATTLGIDSNFLVAILVCIAVLFFLLLAVVVHRRQHDSLNEKDIDDPTETIINYEDEGGGECDAPFNLSVFPMGPTKEALQRRENPDLNSGEPDISVFLDNKKDTCDKDPDNLPFDDVRYYAYEGDGNSTGSLSSLGSCTDDGDLDFNYLSSFGKRFSKLADMYDCDGSDDDTQNGGDEAWC